MNQKIKESVKEYNYYLDQINQVDQHDPRQFDVQIVNSLGVKTKWMALNKESATVLIQWLQQFTH